MKELNISSFSVCFSVYVQRAALTTPPPFGRTLSCQRFAPRLSGVDSSPETSSGPLPRIVSSRLGSGSRRHTLRASMYRIQRTNLNNGAKDNVQQSDLHRSSRKECRNQNRAEQQGIRCFQSGDKRELEERKGRLRKPHGVASRVRMEQSLQLRQDASEGAAHHP